MFTNFAKLKLLYNETVSMICGSSASVEEQTRIIRKLDEIVTKYAAYGAKEMDFDAEAYDTYVRSKT